MRKAIVKMGNHRAIIRCGDHCEIRMTSISPVSNGELVVAPEKVSICGTDIQILRGQRDDPAPIVGHEGLSTVIAAGHGAHGFLGDRVIINPTHPSDPGFLLGHNVNGLLQEQVKIPATAVDAGLVSRVSAAIPAARGTLIEPLAVATYALECLRIERPDSLVVVGDGLIGNLASLIAPRILGQDVLIAMVHRSELGLSWTSAFNPRVVNGLSLGDVVPHMGGAIALLSATHRGGTEPLLTECVRKLGTRFVAAHLVGGLQVGSVSPLLLGVDLHGVRAANTGGPWPPTRILFSSAGRSLALTGNRGVTNKRLEASAVLLEDPDFGEQVDHLITHDCDMENGIEILNQMMSSGSRVIGGELVMRLVIAMS